MARRKGKKPRAAGVMIVGIGASHAVLIHPDGNAGFWLFVQPGARA